ncbi:MAG TPA: TonB-dependent receptor, partial [Vicinamibacterales bacterium]|nr:TonB-dependent receptor [Vicinamibacterales bacterium]
AQTATGQITGTVRDVTGAVMPGVKVVVTNQQTGLTRETKSNNSGDYVIPLLPVGRYLVSGEQAGFKMALHSDVLLTVDQIQRVDMLLEPGNLTETVEVQSQALTLDTASASVGHTITERQVTELPLNGRNFLQLLFLGAGAVETGGEQGAMRQGVGNAISIMGARPTSNNFMIDGTANIDTSLGTPAAVLSVDAIQEFKEQTTTYSAEYGFSSNQINLVSKTGTNEFHGTGFSFFRNDAWDARNFFDDKTRPAPLLDQKQFGFVAGGPVLLPGYDGRNRTFFLVNYEGTRIDRGATNFYTVPTPEELSGRFTTTIIDPVTGAPFPNNTIPPARFSRLAQLALRNNWFPAPNTTAAQGNYQAVRTFPQNQDQFTIRGDQDLARYGRVFFRYTDTSYENTSAGNMIDAGNRVFLQDTKNWQVSHSWPILNTLVNQFRIGRVDARADQHGIACPQGDVDFLGVTGTFTDIPDEQRECPSIGMTGYSGTGGAVNAYTASNQPMWDVSNTATWVRGNHTLIVGANYRRWWLQRDLATGFLGNYAFNVGFTGHRVADMLLGYYSQVGIFQPAAFSVPGAAGNPREFNFTYFAPYFQDDWRVNSRLTLNLGLRWDYRNVPYETRNRMAWRNLDYAPGGLLVADESLVDGGIVDGAYYQYAGRRSPENPDRFKVFAPRLGFAWRPLDDQTVIRGGYGVFFDSAEGREIDGAADVYPYVSRGNYTQSVGQPTPLQTSDALFPSFAAPGVATPAANTFLAVSQSPEPRNPYMQQWSLGVQREVFTRTTLELNYIGTHGSNLLMRRNIAQALPYDPANPLSVSARKPYPNFVTYIDSDWGGRSNYNAFNTKLEHRGRGSIMTVAYTWARSTDSKSAAAGIGASGFNGWQGFLNNHDPERDYGLSDFDVDHRLVGSFVYNLPFGSGEKFASDATGLKNALVGGWQVNGIYTLQRGFPITIQASDAGGLNDTSGTNRADIVGDPDVGERTVRQWFNTAAFAQPGPGMFGTVGRNTLRGPGVNNLDFALFKNFTVTRGVRLQFRLESFNALNHTQFQGVSTNLTSATFGVVTSARAARINQLGFKVIF